MHTNRRAHVLFSVAVFGVLALAAPPATARGQQQKEAKEAATISDRVSLDGRAAAGVYVVLLRAESGPGGGAVARARTDSEGDYRLTGVAPGRYLLLARLPRDAGSDFGSTRPPAWDAAERSALRREAEAAGTPVKLTTCQRVSDLTLLFPPRLRAR